MNFYRCVVAEFIFQVHRDSHVFELVQMMLDTFYKLGLEMVGNVAKDVLQYVPTGEQNIVGAIVNNHG